MICLVSIFRTLNELGCTPFQYCFSVFCFNWYILSTIWNWLRKYEHEVITYRLLDKHNCKTSANHILFHFLKNKQQTLGTSINNLTLSSICTKLKCNAIRACSPLHVYRYTAEKSVQLDTVQLPIWKGVHSGKRQQTKPGGLLSEQHLHYVCQTELPLSLWLTVLAC